ncbi:MAG: DUF2585 family protein [Sphingomicrobium sp.]
MISRSRAALGALLILVVTAAILLAMGRPPICTCGTVALWEPSALSPRTSQMLADWYSASHVVHGFLFYAALWWVARKRPVEHRFLIALLVEVAWEVVENTPLIIDRYREATTAIGYTGDSVINSMSDAAMMAIGFFASRKLPLWASLAIVVVLELVPLFVIRDNLTLNVLMLLAPSDALRGWQGGG